MPHFSFVITGFPVRSFRKGFGFTGTCGPWGVGGGSARRRRACVSRAAHHRHGDSRSAAANKLGDACWLSPRMHGLEKKTVLAFFLRGHSSQATPPPSSLLACPLLQMPTAPSPRLVHEAADEGNPCLVHEAAEEPSNAAEEPSKAADEPSPPSPASRSLSSLFGSARDETKRSASAVDDASPLNERRTHSVLFSKDFSGSGKSLLNMLRTSTVGSVSGSPKKSSSPGSPMGAMRVSMPKRSSPKWTKGHSAPPLFPQPTRDEFHDVVSALLTLATSDRATALVELGFVVPIITLLEQGRASEAVQIDVARTLAHLAAHRENHAAIREAGALGVLLGLLSSSSELLALAALEVLRPLARDPSMKDQLREGAPTHVPADSLPLSSRT